MKHLTHLLLLLIITSCNLPKWNQKRLDKKFNRNEVVRDEVDLKNAHINFFHGGQGDPVLLIHGFGGDAQITWQKSILDLAEDHYVIAPDLLWFGRSYSTDPQNLTSQVKSMFDLMDHLKVEKFSLAGISYGGFVALGMTYYQRERVEKLCIVDSPGTTFDLEVLKDLCRQQKVNEIPDIFVCKTPQDVQELSDLGKYKSKKIPKGILNDTYDLYFAQFHKEQTQLLNTMPAEKEKFMSMSIENFPKSRIIWGEHDMVFPLSEGKKFAKFLGAEIDIIPNAGHAPNLDNFKAFQTALRGFITD